MCRLDPAAEAKLNRYNELKPIVKGAKGGSRAEDYKAKASKSAAEAVAEAKQQPFKNIFIK